MIKWEDLKKARAERAAREIAVNKKGKGKRGQKRKALAQYREEEAMPLDAEASPSRTKDRVSKKSRVLEPAP